MIHHVICAWPPFNWKSQEGLTKSSIDLFYVLQAGIIQIKTYQTIDLYGFYSYGGGGNSAKPTVLIGFHCDKPIMR